MKHFPIPVIALSGPIGCGKTKVSSHFKKMYPDWVQVSYADGFKQVLEFVYGFPVGMQNLQSFKSSKQTQFGGNISVRDIQRHVANVGFRPLHELTWADFTYQVIQALHDPLNSWYDQFPVFRTYIDSLCAKQRVKLANVQGVLIDDLRFESDCNSFISKGGRVVYIYREKAEHDFLDSVDRHHMRINRIARAMNWPAAFTLDRSELEIVYVKSKAHDTFSNHVNLDSHTQTDANFIEFFWKKQVETARTDTDVWSST